MKSTRRILPADVAPLAAAGTGGTAVGYILALGAGSKNHSIAAAVDEGTAAAAECIAHCKFRKPVGAAVDAGD